MSEKAPAPDKTVARKLLIKEGYRVLLVNAPAGYAAFLGELPEGAVLAAGPESGPDLIHLFVASCKELEANLPRLKTSLKANGLLWVSYPKGTSKIQADINRDSINAYARSIGLQGVAMISIDDIWSALRLRPVS
jgi:hypothetical protein